MWALRSRWLSERAIVVCGSNVLGTQSSGYNAGVRVFLGGSIGVLVD